jgi:hypothetical protein
MQAILEFQLPIEILFEVPEAIIFQQNYLAEQEALDRIDNDPDSRNPSECNPYRLESYRRDDKS